MAIPETYDLVLPLLEIIKDKDEYKVQEITDEVIDYIDISDEDKDEKVLENQKVLLTPIVRNGKLATVGYCPDVWKNWK